jgi:hypothetical protein
MVSNMMESETGVLRAWNLSDSDKRQDVAID